MKIKKLIREIKGVFKLPIKKYYLGEITHGTPYFYPRSFNGSIITFRKLELTSQEDLDKLPNDHLRNAKKFKNLPMGKTTKNIIFKLLGNHYYLEIGYPIVYKKLGLGWKDKFNSPRQEWSPAFYLFFFKWQFCIWWIKDLPKKVETKSADQTTNLRYELKEGFPESELTPKVIPSNEMDYDSDIRGLYVLKSDTIEGKLEEVSFEIELLSEEDNFYVEKPKYISTPSLLNALATHPALHMERPCSISGKEFYKIIRNHIKLNIDPKYARITSDYDFCLTVEKVISHEPIPYSVVMGTKRRPRNETRYRNSRSIKIFQTSPEGYTDYPTQKPINGLNQKDLEEKVDLYLNELMEEINKPFIECEHCNGMGVILNK